jgi:phosphotransferase system, enzyme I, PtsP
VTAPAPQPREVLPQGWRLLRRLRDVMAGGGDGRTRLNKIVTLIATEMQADVCSCYIMRAGEILELFATHGLRQEAINVTRLLSGEGIIGTIAASGKPLALTEARAHANFAYRPETGEDPFSSMLGVPILRGGRVRGVLALQHRIPHTYDDDAIELLATVAMVVAEMLGQDSLVPQTESTDTAATALRALQLEGITLNGGMVAGLAVLHRPLPELRQTIAEDVGHERDRLDRALHNLLGEIDSLLTTPHFGNDTDSQSILEAYRLIAADHGWMTKLQQAVRQGLTAEAAVQKVRNDYRIRFGQMTEPVLREKLADFDDMVDRLLRQLTGRPADTVLPDDAILIARSLGPAELLDYDRSKLRGLVLETGTMASHVAIIAKALDLPVLGQCSGALNRLEALDALILDADHGRLYVRPSEDIQEEFLRHQEAARRRRAAADALRDEPDETRDGVAIELLLNCGLELDFEHLEETRAVGVGLYRTEIPFMVRDSFPDLAEQTEIYRRAFALADGRDMVIRTLDVGGDKMLPSLTIHAEENPALGWRAIRIGLDRPAILRQQLAALLAAANGRPFSLMFPMVATVAELQAAKEILAVELAARTKRGEINPVVLQVGVIVEVPALLWQLPALLPMVDFLCVGSNDLLQYMFAADRGNSLLAARYDPLSPGFLLMLRELVACSAIAGKPLSICGEMAGRPLEAMALLGLGVRRLSFSPSAHRAIKRMLRSLPVKPLKDYLSSQLLRPDPSLRDKLKCWAQDHQVVVE